ncbi:MAG: hypothetical protein ACOVKS_04455, partial [Aquimonas sp.]
MTAITKLRGLRRLRRVALALSTLLVLVACTRAPGGAAGEVESSAPAPLARTLQLGEDTEDFDTVTPRALSFPAVHGAHPRHRIEWWYLTARLQDA